MFQIFLIRLLRCFWKNFRWISSINGYFNTINGSKNIKCCEFCLKILYRVCREIAEKRWIWWNIIYHLFETNILQRKVYKDKQNDTAKYLYTYDISPCYRYMDYKRQTFLLNIFCHIFDNEMSMLPLKLISDFSKYQIWQLAPFFLEKYFPI